MVGKVVGLGFEIIFKLGSYFFMTVSTLFYFSYLTKYVTIEKDTTSQKRDDRSNPASFQMKETALMMLCGYRYYQD